MKRTRTIVAIALIGAGSVSAANPGSGPLLGRLDVVRAGCVSGWTLDPSSPATPPPVRLRVLVAGKRVGEVELRPDIERPELESFLAGSPESDSSRCGFSADPARWLPGTWPADVPVLAEISARTPAGDWPVLSVARMASGPGQLSPSRLHVQVDPDVDGLLVTMALPPSDARLPEPSCRLEVWGVPVDADMRTVEEPGGAVSLVARVNLARYPAVRSRIVRERSALIAFRHGAPDSREGQVLVAHELEVWL